MLKVIIEGGTMYYISTYDSSHRGNTSDRSFLRVSQESRDTQTGGGGGGIELCPSRDDPRIVQVSQESRDTQTRGVELCPSWDDPRTVRVSQESRDTQTRRVELCPSRGSISDPKFILGSY